MTRDELLSSIGLDPKGLDPMDVYFAELAISKDKLILQKRTQGQGFTVADLLTQCTAEEKLEILERVKKQSEQETQP